jgi:hypothetical protein
MTDIIAPPTISAFPPAPQPTDTPTEFDAKAFAKVNADVAFVPQANALASNVFSNATAANERANAAAGSASGASGSASAAAGSASAASGSASAAAGSASSASTSASNAAASYTSMQKLYLGPKSSPPTTDNQGGALALGAWYVNTTLGSWFWWNGSNWVLGMSDVAGSFVPLAGGVNMSGYLGVPAGATGNQAPRANEVTPRATATFTNAALMADAPLGVWAGYETGAGDGADWPPSGGSTFSWWNVITFGVAGRKSQMAMQALGISPVKGAVWVRGQQDSTWSPWQRLLGDQTMIERVVTAVQSGSSYAPDPASGTVHQLTVNAACTISPVTPRLGDQFTIKAQFSGGAWPLTFAASVKPPTGSAPTYAAGQILPLIFECSRTGIWDLSYGQVRAV